MKYPARDFMLLEVSFAVLHTKLQYSPKIMQAQEVAQEVLAPQEHASGENAVYPQEVQNPARKKPQELRNVN